MFQDQREVSSSSLEVAGDNSASAATATAHGIEIAIEFKPIEHPIEPLDNDRPIQCPLPEPSILNVSLNFLVLIAVYVREENYFSDILKF